MKTKKKQPFIRFKGFNEDWEEKKLKEVSDKVFSGGTPLVGKKEYYNGGIPFIRSGEINSDDTEIKITKEGLENSSAKMVIKGTILYALYGATSGEVGISKINGAINQAILAIELKDSYNNIFVFERLNLMKDSIVSKYLQGGQGNLSGKIVKEIKILYPGDIEQEKIGSILSNINKLISLQEQKLELLEQVKKGLLQKLFPKKGSKVPEIRFRDFEGEWDRIKLSEISRIRTGKLNANAMVKNGKYDFYTSGIEKYKINDYAFEGPAITIAGNGATVGYMHIADGKFNAYQRTYVLDNLKLDRIFMFYIINKKLPNKIFNEARMGSIPYIVKNMLDDLIIDYSEQKEHRKIGNIISVFNNNIKYNNSKLQQLQAMKQSLLQQMFI